MWVSCFHEAPGVLWLEATMVVTQQGWLLWRWCFPVASDAYFYRGKVGACEFFKRLFPEMQTSVSGFVFFLEESK